LIRAGVFASASSVNGVQNRTAVFHEPHVFFRFLKRAEVLMHFLDDDLAPWRAPVGTPLGQGDAGTLVTHSAPQKGDHAPLASDDPLDNHPEVVELLGLLPLGLFNILFTGPQPRICRALQALKEHLSLPSTVWSSRTASTIRDEATGIVMIENVDAYCLDQQHSLLEWLGTDRTGARVVTTTTTALFPLIADGRFLPELYYRLNSVLVDLW
jgi:hypothetical protein